MRIFLVGIVLLFASCNTEISIEERNKLLDKAFADIQSSNEDVVIEGIRIMKKYPTHEGTKKLLSLWETDLSEGVEKEILATLRKDEIFRGDDSLIDEIFGRNYTVGIPIKKKLKLRRLLQRTDADINYKLVKIIDNDLSGKLITCK